MKTLRTSRKAKVTAFILCVLCLTMALGCRWPLQWLDDMEARYGWDRFNDRVEELILENWVMPIQDTVHSWHYDNAAPADTDQWIEEQLGYIESWTEGDPNLFFTVRGEDGRLIYGSRALGDYRAKYAQTVTLPKMVKVNETCDTAAEQEAALEQLERTYDEVNTEGMNNEVLGRYTLKANCYEDGELMDVYEDDFYSLSDADQTIADLQDQYDRVDYGLSSRDADGKYLLKATCIDYDGGETLTVSGFLRANMTPTGQTWSQLYQAARLYGARTAYQVLIPAGAVIGLLCLVFLLWSAGHAREGEGIVLSGFDRRGPVDLLIPAGAVAVLIWLSAGLDAPGHPLIQELFPIQPFALLCIALAFGLFVLLSVVRRFKAKQSQRDVLFFTRAGRVCGKGLRRLGRKLEALTNTLPLFWLAALVFLACCLLEGLSVIAIAGGNEVGVFLWFLCKALELAGAIWLVLAFRRLQEGGRELAAGNLDYQVSLDRLYGPFRTHGEHLNSIRSAIQRAVEERMKSERMKTELIANVSHDIKTPLTSIVSYVDLLKKQPMPTEEAKEYLEVLDRQSARLKKLTEDLVEASKASTGNLPVDLERTDVNVLLSQSAGEYQERLRERDLTLVLTPAEGSPAILADGRLLWRVFDNLLSNVRKYAQPGTRVYLSCEADGKTVTVLFRNISAGELNISPDELMERFVRGDQSRSTEGSGLGLSIARSLTLLQGGTFDLAIDGDLFKAVLTFPRID